MGCGTSIPQNSHTPKNAGMSTMSTRQVRNLKVSKKIEDYESPEALYKAMVEINVIEDFNLIVGIDTTGSNKFTGRNSFGGRNLHDWSYHGADVNPNPYGSVIRCMEKIIRADKDSSIPLFYFGSTQAKEHGGAFHVGDAKDVKGLEDMYKSTIISQMLDGPTTFAPLIKNAIEVIKETKKYHCLLIITDGAVHPDLIKENWNAIAEASKYPMSIIAVGVGDGPWKQMESFDDHMPKGRLFDNFQFVNFNEVVSSQEDHHSLKEEFFFRAFMEIPEQYKIIKNLLGYTSHH